MKQEKNKFLVSALFFFIFLLILILLINLIYYKIVIPEKNLYRNQIQYKAAIQTSPKIFFFGDSHTVRGANPEFINSSFNYATPGENYDHHYYKLRKLLEIYEPVEIIVFPLDVHSFIDHGDNTPDEEWFWRQFTSTKELSKLEDKSLLGTLIKSFFPVIGNGKDFITLVISQDRTEMIQGWQKSETRFNDTGKIDSIGMKDGKDHTKNYPKSYSEDFFSYAKKIVDLAEAYNKKIVFVKYPVTQEYLQGVASTNFSIEDHYEKVIPKLNTSRNIIVLDYQEFLEDQPELFYDSHHLNSYGAEIFSEDLNKELSALLPPEDETKHRLIFLN